MLLLNNHQVLAFLHFGGNCFIYLAAMLFGAYRVSFHIFIDMILLSHCIINCVVPFSMLNLQFHFIRQKILPLLLSLFASLYLAGIT